MKWRIPDQEVNQGKPRRTWREVVLKDCQAYKLIRENAVDHSI